MSPPIPIEEGRLRFEFDAQWQAAVKWDDSLAYRKGIGLLPDTKAVDILCRSKGRCVLIEVKDFRGHRIENKPRVASGELQQEVALKVRDTLAGILGASRLNADGGYWQPYAKALVSNDDVYVVLWLEEDFAPPVGPGTQEQRWKTRLSTVLNVLKQRLHWLTPNVLVTSVREVGRLPGVQVSNLPHP